MAFVTLNVPSFFLAIILCLCKTRLCSW